MCSRCVETGIQVFGQLLSWSPDSRFVVVAASPSDETSNAITAVDVTSGKTSRLTTPPAGAALDQLPSLSPDGGTLAFVRRSGGQTGELWLQPLSGDVCAHRRTHTRWVRSALLPRRGVEQGRTRSDRVVRQHGERRVVEDPGAEPRGHAATVAHQRRMAAACSFHAAEPVGVHADDLGREPLAAGARGCGAPSRSCRQPDGLDTPGNECAVLAGRVSDCLREPALGHPGAVGGRCR